jgi:hypothetical protein
MEASLVLRECLELREKSQPDDWSTAETRGLLGEALAGQKDYQGAEPLLLAAQKTLSSRRTKIPPPDRDRTLRDVAGRLIRLYEAWGKLDRASEWKVKFGLSDLPADVFARP